MLEYIFVFSKHNFDVFVVFLMNIWVDITSSLHTALCSYRGSVFTNQSVWSFEFDLFVYSFVCVNMAEAES